MEERKASDLRGDIIPEEDEEDEEESKPAINEDLS